MKFTNVFEKDSEINIYNLLKHRGIKDEDFYYFLNPEKEHNLLNPFLLDNMQKAIEVLKKHLENNSIIMINIDPDADGFTSGAKLYRYVKRICPNANLKIFIPDNKAHGISKELMELEYDLLICPDSSTNDIVQQQELISKGKDVLILDHHHGEYETYPAIVVNNQTCNYPNKNLSGVGVVQKFCEAYDQTYHFNFAFEDLDLVAVGMVGDMVEINNLEQIYYISNGLNDVQNLLLLGIVASNSFILGNIEHLTPKIVSWNFSPVINAVIRVGDVPLKTKMFQAMIEYLDYPVQSTKRSNKPGDTEMLVGQVCREATNARSRQKRIIEKNMPILLKAIEEQNDVENDAILFAQVKESKDFPTSMNGMLSMKLTEHFNRPVMVLKETAKKGTISGSGRSTDEIEGLREMLAETDLFNYASGHSGAFGLSLDIHNIDEAKKAMNEKLSAYEQTIYLDYLFENILPDSDQLMQIVAYDRFFGKGLEMPKLGVIIQDLGKITTELCGKNKDTVRFKIDSCDFISFGLTEEEINMFKNPSGKKLLLVGEASINSYYGVGKGQFLINDFIEI